MPRTAVVNPRRRRRRKARKAAKSRRKNPEVMEMNSRRRRRRAKRRYYGASKRRRRNPSSSKGASLAPRRSSSAARTKNPAMGLDDVIQIAPAATAGVWAARWALAQAGEFEDGQPGFKHALAIYLAASFGADVLGSMFGQGKAMYARVGALAFGGDLFLRKRFMKDSSWVKENLSLQGVDDAAATYAYSQGRDYANMGAETFVDAVGNRYVQTPQGWALAGMGDDGSGTGQLVMDEEGNVYQLGGFESSSPIGGFESTSPIGALAGRRNAGDSSFGYV